MLMRLNGNGIQYLVETDKFDWARPALPHEMAPPILTLVSFAGERFGVIHTLEQVERLLKGLHPDAV
jgi:hypothetical protein